MNDLTSSPSGSSFEPPYHARGAPDVLSDLHVERPSGLTEGEAARRREQHGPNELRKAEERSRWRIFFAQFKSVVIGILLAAGVLAAAFQQWEETIAIAAVVLINAGLGYVSEWRAVRSMEALRTLAAARARVRRDGSERGIDAKDLVPGDIVVLEGGDKVPADLRLLEANDIRVNESALTGESVPVMKSLDPVDEDAPIADRLDMLYKGTTIAQGSGEAVVVATGQNTELGRISEMTETAEAETPLEKRLNSLGRKLALVTIVVAAAVAGIGLLAGQPTLLMIETAIALGVAAIPEGLPVVTTIALARGMWRMAKRQALVKRLTAVETLGATRVILTDKTGTLTENRMTVRCVATPDGERAPDAGEESPALLRALEVGVLCNNASLADGEHQENTGDPMELALLVAGREAGIERSALLERWPEVREVAFNPEVRMMATVHEADDGYLFAVKGAPSAVIDACERVVDGEGDAALDEPDRERWKERAHEMAARGLRVLAVADKRSDDQDEPYEGLRLLGLYGLVDPPRPGVRKALEECETAGIRVAMVTGDTPETALAIGRQVGLVPDSDDAVVHGRDLSDPAELSDDDRQRLLRARIFARVNPGQKLHLVRLFQEAGDTVAMTGDGVNDAPALKKADIGVAMGLRGTDAAREAAAMVLRDDAFSSIVAAIEEGRVIFANIRKSVLFMLCTNVAEILAVAVASLAGIPPPLHPLQILFLNVGTDVFPAMALVASRGDADVMKRPPRPPGEAVLTRAHWLGIGGWGAGIAAVVLVALGMGLWWLGADAPTSITMSFLTLGFAKLWFVFNLRDRGTRVTSNAIVRNPFIWGAIVLCIGLLLMAVYVPGLNTVLDTRPLSGAQWGIVLGLSVVPFLVGQVLRSRKRPV